MTTTTLRTARFATVLIALAALAIAVPLAQAAPAGDQECTQASTTMQSPYEGWVIVTDEQGVPTLYPVGFAPDDATCVAEAHVNPPAQANAQAPTMQSPYPGWVIVIDEQGVPTLYPIEFAPTA
jgi:hypothetical protein